MQQIIRFPCSPLDLSRFSLSRFVCSRYHSDSILRRFISPDFFSYLIAFGAIICIFNLFVFNLFVMAFAWGERNMRMYILVCVTDCQPFYRKTLRHNRDEKSFHISAWLVDYENLAPVPWQYQIIQNYFWVGFMNKIKDSKCSLTFDILSETY